MTEKNSEGLSWRSPYLRRTEVSRIAVYLSQLTGKKLSHRYTGLSASHLNSKQKKRMTDYRLLVSNLSWYTTDEILRQAFSQFGEVTFAKIIRDSSSGRSRGFGFIAFASIEEATKAIDGMNGKEFGGRVISVKFFNNSEGDQYE